MKLAFAGSHVENDNGVNFPVKSFFNEQGPKFYLSGIHALPHGWGECFALFSDYADHMCDVLLINFAIFMRNSMILARVLLSKVTRFVNHLSYSGTICMHH